MQLMVQSENLNFHQVDLTWTNLSCYRYSRTLTIAKSSHYNLRRSILKKNKANTLKLKKIKIKKKKKNEW